MSRLVEREHGAPAADVPLAENAMIEFEHVERSYGGKIAVRDLHFSIADGELFCLLGPNGAGKTTTIKMLVGLLRPGKGVVRVNGHDIVKETRQALRQLSYVPDEPYLYEKLTGREFLDFIGRMYGLGNEDRKKNIGREIQRFSLERFVDDLAGNYSHGMKQRMVFAAACLHDPKVLIVDEPMVGLDPRSVRLVKDLLKAQARAGATVFVSTHMLSIAEEIGDTIAVIHQGRLLFRGTLAELRSSPSFSAARRQSLGASPIPSGSDPGEAGSGDSTWREQLTLEQLFLEMTEDGGLQEGGSLR